MSVTPPNIPLDGELGGLVKPCGDKLRPADPPRPASGPPIAITLSGGGFRATFPALGVIRYLADAGLLANLRISSSVSGGSVANAMLAKMWPALRGAEFTAKAVDQLVIAPLAERVAKDSLTFKVLRNSWRAVSGEGRTGVLAWAFDDWFFGEMRLDELDPEVRWIFNGGNLATGTRFTFERDVVGDYVNGLAPTEGTGLSLSLAAATSAAVPGAFSEVTLKDIKFPCRTKDSVQVMDGGVYDNTGLEPISSSRYDDFFSLSLAAGGVFTVGSSGILPLVGVLSRANSVMYRQTRTLRTRDMVRRFEMTPPPRSGAVFALTTSIPQSERNPAYDAFVARYPEDRTYDGKDLAFVATTFRKLDAALIRKLVYRGWWLAGATMAVRHPDMAPLPASTVPPG
jgi:NTE family protein